MGQKTSLPEVIYEATMATYQVPAMAIESGGACLMRQLDKTLVRNFSGGSCSYY